MTSPPNNRQLRLRVYWGDVLYDTRLLKERTNICVGPSEANDYVLDLTSAKESHALVSWSKDICLIQPFSAGEGFLTTGKTTSPIRLIKKDTTPIALEKDSAADLPLGDCTFSLDWVHPPEHLEKDPVTPGTTLFHSVGIASFLLVTFFLAPYFSEPLKEQKKFRTVQIVTVKEPPKPEIKPEINKVEPEPQVTQVAPVIEPPVVTKRLAPKTAAPSRTRVVTSPTPPTAIADPFAGKDDWSELSDSLKKLDHVERKPAKADYIPNQALKFSPEEEKLRETRGQGTGQLAKLGSISLPTGATQSATDAIDRDAIQSFVSEKEPRLSFCFQKALTHSDKLSGYATVRFTILPTGAASNIKIVDSSPTSPELAQCITAEISRWTFPKIRAGFSKNPTIVEFPFTFEKR